ncbi:hypothetical protein AVEN_222287-1, partial [Araneus ventricosus]
MWRRETTRDLTSEVTSDVLKNENGDG